jgi:biotin transport system substrate-specific component
MEVYIKKFKHVRYNFFKWRYETSLVNKTVLALTFACLTGVLAQVKL